MTICHRTMSFSRLLLRSSRLLRNPLRPRRKLPLNLLKEEVVDETGLNPDDITFVMEQTKCTRAAAVKALRENDNDMINAVMALGK